MSESTTNLDWYVLVYEGPKPAKSYYATLEGAIRARDKARKDGYHVTIKKLLTPTPEAPIAERTKTTNRNNNNFFTKLADSFRKRTRTK